ncbi:MAG: hypothetical protein F6K19_17235 [Cyanothece sp. SIO1E1]|nr:hypothetical protein [Cyanothece sp. SIO1E1]
MESAISGKPETGVEMIDLGGGPVHCRIEAMPIQIQHKSCVLSLLHWLDAI